MFTIYFDESGSPRDTPALVVAGLLAPTEQWVAFERDWKDALAAFGVSQLHMRKFAHSVDEFQSWKGDERKRRGFLSRLINIICTRVRHTFADAVLMNDYREVDQEYYLSEIFKPYTVAGRTCVSKVNNWAKEHGVGPNEITYMFEDGASDKGDLLHRLKRDLSSKFSFHKKNESDVFQAADLLAYEHLLANTRILNGDIQAWKQLRHPLRELDKIPNGKGGIDWGVYHAHNLRDLCINTNIPRRPAL